MQIEKILEILYGKRKDYKGTQIMRELLTKNETFNLLFSYYVSMIDYKSVKMGGIQGGRSYDFFA